ncbi:hypothetical protein LK464_03620 [Mycobacteroides abscessus subsp. abscessus]|uniref:hypothetical protein n=1 Tax=Mycobacteroides abscessus TaxID=36809 RepID=UPI001D156037|nr:hypothetical protein [Mycobacteroides abscessus]UEA25156.1 hypothetical protein LK464_03620 [Mycobacteroides abscessus subsp. abscessus]
MRWFARPDGERVQLNGSPQLDSWDQADTRSQVELRTFLDEAEAVLAPSRIGDPWALRLDVGLAPHLDLLSKRDLDNYAKPLASRLSDGGLVSVWCTKRSGAGSSVRIEAAREVPAPSNGVLLATTTASWDGPVAKEQVRSALAGVSELPDGPVGLELAFTVGPSRNWLNLWKPTIDSLGALLGHEQPFRPWNPRDGRITELGMHLDVDPSLRYEVVIGIAARPAAAVPTGGGTYPSTATGPRTPT